LAITFDDGFAGVHAYAFPTLRRYRLPATVFVVVETLTLGGRLVDWVDGKSISPLGTLSVEQVLEMRDAGISFGSHSLAHRDLTTLSEEDCYWDLRTSREILEDLIQQHVPFLAYPRGRHDERVRRAAERAGFMHAFSLPDRPDPVGTHAIPRVGIYAGNSLPVLRVKTLPGYLRLRTSRLVARLRPAPQAHHMAGVSA
jgi:peptidoglycan/xylan/chitin deacetylase (PgdA/CDA1 family)